MHFASCHGVSGDASSFIARSSKINLLLQVLETAGTSSSRTALAPSSSQHFAHAYALPALAHSSSQHSHPRHRSTLSLLVRSCAWPAPALMRCLRPLLRRCALFVRLSHCCDRCYLYYADCFHTPLSCHMLRPCSHLLCYRLPSCFGTALITLVQPALSHVRYRTGTHQQDTRREPERTKQEYNSSTQPPLLGAGGSGRASLLAVARPPQTLWAIMATAAALACWSAKGMLLRL